MTEKKQQHKIDPAVCIKCGKLSEKEKNIWKSCFFFREYPKKNACGCEKSDYGQGK